MQKVGNNPNMNMQVPAMNMAQGGVYRMQTGMQNNVRPMNQPYRPPGNFQGTFLTMRKNLFFFWSEQHEQYEPKYEYEHEYESLNEQWYDDERWNGKHGPNGQQSADAAEPHAAEPTEAGTD